MMIVRAAPDAARAKGKDPKEPHQDLRQPRIWQDGVVLLIVVDDERPEDEQPCDHAARHLCERMEIPLRARQRCRQKHPSGENMPPTARGRIFGELLRRQDEFDPGLHSFIICRSFAMV